jgi:hypothetical protein
MTGQRINVFLGVGEVRMNLFFLYNIFMYSCFQFSVAYEIFCLIKYIDINY